MPQQLHGYEDNLSSKGSALREVTVTKQGDKAASGSVISTIDSAKALGTLDFEIPFSTGLTVVTSSGAKIVVVYE